MKKVLFVTSLYHPHVGGVETMVRELSSLYFKKGIKSIVLTKKWPKTLEEYEQFEETDIYRIISARSDEEFLEVVNWINSNIDCIKADIIHIVGIRRPLPLIGLLLGRIWKVPVICTIAGGDIPDKLDPDPGKVWDEGINFIPQTLLQADFVNCVSNSLSDDLRALMPDLSRIETLYAGMDFSIIRNVVVEKIESSYIFSLRRLEPSKGVDVLINAFMLIKEDFPKLNLVIAGDGSEAENLKKLVSKHELNDRVSFIGTVNFNRGISILKGATLTVVPSLSEGGGLVNIEAQAVGCPVIASRVGGIPEYLSDGESGLLFNPGDYYDLAQKMKQIMTDNVLRMKIIDGGLKYAKNFDWDIIGEQYIDLYRKSIEGLNLNKTFIPWSPLTEMLWNKLKK